MTSKELQKKLDELQKKRAELLREQANISREHRGNARSLGSIIFAGNRDEGLVDQLSKTIARREGLQEAIKLTDEELTKVQAEHAAAVKAEAEAEILSQIEQLEREMGAYFKTLYAAADKQKVWNAKISVLISLSERFGLPHLYHRLVGDRQSLPWDMANIVREIVDNPYRCNEAHKRFMRED